MAPAHEALDRVDGAPRVGDGLALGRVADEAFALVGEGDDAGRQAVAFLVGDDLDLAAFHDRDDRVGGAQVDADDFFSFCHVFCSFLGSRSRRPRLRRIRLAIIGGQQLVYSVHDLFARLAVRFCHVEQQIHAG